MGMPDAVKKCETRHFINGEFVPSSDGGTFEVKSPYNHETVAHGMSFPYSSPSSPLHPALNAHPLLHLVSEATTTDINTAVSAAKAAFPAWSALSPAARGAHLSRLAGLIQAAHEPLSHLDASCMGRPVSSYFDAASCASEFSQFAAEGWLAQGSSSLHTPGMLNLVLKQPIGVVAAIIPWNAPVIMFGMKVAPALAAGCTVVLKSSEKAPLSNLWLAMLIKEAGFPPGVVNVVSGHGRPGGEALASHMDVRCMTFTGSTATGRRVQELGAKSNLKRVVLELGGKSPSLIFPDADLAKAAVETQFSMSLISGQVCIANSRIYVHESVAEEFQAAFAKAFQEKKRGDPLDPTTDQGPQADNIQYNRVKDYLEAGKAGKGKLEFGGNVVKMEGGNGFFIEPTVFTNTPEDAKTMKEEIFGPVVHINTFKTEQEAIEKANDTEYGLYASVYTEDLSRAMRVSKALEAGSIGVNCTSPARGSDMPFGGWKGSGQGREGFAGYSLENFLETKSVMIKVSEEVKPVAVAAHLQ
ncbi:aldehyde dehydrogenase [Viridothelium virens]|uniref:aldehyde dehydrogenase (NAD(+)) n=1 Tax=Viridothelium virens TaxID=1048519 RepID=A0A6A6H0V8_VIRVR|nr:aldehyde dehydrogenase [Viridothelium virens]